MQHAVVALLLAAMLNASVAHDTADGGRIHFGASGEPCEDLEAQTSAGNLLLAGHMGQAFVDAVGTVLEAALLDVTGAVLATSYIKNDEVYTTASGAVWRTVTIKFYLLSALEQTTHTVFRLVESSEHQPSELELNLMARMAPAAARNASAWHLSLQRASDVSVPVSVPLDKVVVVRGPTSAPTAAATPAPTLAPSLTTSLTVASTPSPASTSHPFSDRGALATATTTTTTTRTVAAAPPAAASTSAIAAPASPSGASTTTSAPWHSLRGSSSRSRTRPAGFAAEERGAGKAGAWIAYLAAPLGLAFCSLCICATAAVRFAYSGYWLRRVEDASQNNHPPGSAAAAAAAAKRAQAQPPLRRQLGQDVRRSAATKAVHPQPPSTLGVKPLDPAVKQQLRPTMVLLGKEGQYLPQPGAPRSSPPKMVVGWT
eukprot:TRINITY_DN19786_c0_g1_i3.p1 TRINITY_DN19786_c0_g1~~TRINITY_DN19786_c0_g1_i3.p1  ORF type:complete len:429 (+),score=77.47 TRINITY_DN19786_c0_g1_i3:37-1323(+)